MFLYMFPNCVISMREYIPSTYQDRYSDNHYSKNYSEIVGKLKTLICPEKVVQFQWIYALFFSSLFHSIFVDGYSDIDAQLVVRKYIEKGSSVTMYCEHNVDPKILYKVSILTGWYLWECEWVFRVSVGTSRKLQLCSRELESLFVSPLTTTQTVHTFSFCLFFFATPICFF